MMMNQLSGIFLLKHGNQRLLTRAGIRPQGLKYLKAMGFDERIYTTPPPRSKTQAQL